MDASYTVSVSKLSEYEDVVPSDVVDSECIDLKTKYVGTEAIDLFKDMSEDKIFRLIDKLSESEHQEIASLFKDQLETPRTVFTTLLKDKRILYLQLLLISVGREDIVFLMKDFAQTHRLVHVRRMTKCVFTIVVFDDIPQVIQHELLTVVRSWIPEDKAVVTNCLCPMWMKKLDQIRKCQRCLQHMGVINHILKAYTRQRDISLVRKWNETSEISIAICDTGCEKCSMIDHKLVCLLNAVREALYNFNTLKCSIKRYKAKALPLRSTYHKDANGNAKRIRSD